MTGYCYHLANVASTLLKRGLFKQLPNIKYLI
jgi:hypothetical protein